TVNKASTTTSLGASAIPSVYGQDVTFTAFVTATAPGTGTPDGQAQLSIDGSPFGAPFTLTGGQGSITVPGFNNLIGAHAVQVNYLGSANYSTSNSGGTTQTVNKATTTTSLVASANPSVYGQDVTFTAFVAATAPGTGTPDGQAQLYVDGSTVGAPFALTGGQGSITVAHFNNLIGAHTVQVNYLGSANYSASNSGGTTQRVNPASTTTS